MKKILQAIGLLLTINSLLFSMNSDKETKTIYLYGNHYPDSPTDYSFRMLISELACERQVVFAMEALERELLAEEELSQIIKQSLGVTGKAYIYGVESPLLLIFKGSLNLNSFLRSIEQGKYIMNDEELEIYQTKQNDILCPLVNKSNQKFLDTFWENEELVGNPIFDYLQNNKNKLIKKTFSEQMAIFYQKFKEWDYQDWINFTNKVTLSLNPMMTKIIPTEKLKTLTFLMSCLDNFELESNCDANAESGYFQDALIDLREDFIINNLEEIYSITKEKKRPVVAFLDKSFIERIKRGLKQKGFTVLGKKELLTTLTNEEL